jgi:hypothetical protein
MAKDIETVATDLAELIDSIKRLQEEMVEIGKIDPSLPTYKPLKEVHK